MSSPVTLAAMTLPNLHPFITNGRPIPRLLHTRSCNPILTVFNPNSRTNQVPLIRSAAIMDNPSAAPEEEEIRVKVGARVRVTVPLKVYHIPKVAEVELNGMEGKVKEYVAVWKGKHISANLPYKIEFVEILEGRGDTPVKFFAHLKDDEFEYIID